VEEIRTSRGKGRFDERDQFAEGQAQLGVILADFVEVASGVVLLPELFGQGLGKMLEAVKIRAVRCGKIEETIEVVNAFKLPAA
jgi:hypothetical protein